LNVDNPRVHFISHEFTYSHWYDSSIVKIDVLIYILVLAGVKDLRNLFYVWLVTYMASLKLSLHTNMKCSSTFLAGCRYDIFRSVRASKCVTESNRSAAR
jgi:hypothetical protein